MGHPLLDLSNKTAVVIGGTSGIGLALAKALATAGASVVPSSRQAEQVRNAVSEVEALGRQSFAQTCDVTDNASLEDLLKAASREFGDIHILVNCAGCTKKMPTLPGSRRTGNSPRRRNGDGTERSPAYSTV